MLRAAVEAGTPVGLQGEEIMAEGESGHRRDRHRHHRRPDRRARLRQGRSSSTASRAPLAQADALDELLQSKGRDIDCVIELKVDDTSSCERMETSLAPGRDDRGRRHRSGRRQRRGPKTRLMAYYRETAPLIGFYYVIGC